MTTSSPEEIAAIVAAVRAAERQVYTTDESESLGLARVLGVFGGFAVQSQEKAPSLSTEGEDGARLGVRAASHQETT